MVRELTEQELAMAEDRRQFDLRTRKGRTQVDYLHDPTTGKMVASEGDLILARYGFMPEAIRVKDGILHQDSLLDWPAKVELVDAPLKGWSMGCLRHNVMGYPKRGLLMVQAAPHPSGQPMRRVYFRTIDFGSERERAKWLAELATADELLRAKWLREWQEAWFKDIPEATRTLGMIREMDTE